MRSARRVGLGLASAAVLAGAAVALGSCSSSSPGSSTAQKTTPVGGRDGRPNFVLIQVDDETSRQFSRRVMPKTFKLLVDRGTSFSNYVATTAQCCPSRASLLTGQYAHNDGVTSNQVGYLGLIHKRNLLPVWLQRAGYRTLHVGAKYMNRYEDAVDPRTKVAPGWDQWFTSVSSTRYFDYDVSDNGDKRHYGNAPSDYIERVLGDKAASLIHRYGRSRRPFYLQLDTRAPHVSEHDDPHGRCDRLPIPDTRDRGRFRHAQLPSVPSFNERDMSDKPAFLRAAHPLGAGLKHHLQVKWRCALETVVSIDRTVRKVFHAVDRVGGLKNTVFVFVSDNGVFYGEHRIGSKKVFPYEEGIRLPLVIKLPGRYRGGRHRVPKIDEVAGNIDLAPTILDLAGGKPCRAPGHCRTMDGRSLMPLLRGRDRLTGRQGLLLEYRERSPHYLTCKFAGIRTRNQVYIEHYRVSNAGQPCMRQHPPQVERYDLKTDPFELDNLCPSGSPSRCPTTPTQRRLERGLGALRICAGVKGRDPRVNGRPYCS